MSCLYSNEVAEDREDGAPDCVTRGDLSRVDCLAFWLQNENDTGPPFHGQDHNAWKNFHCYCPGRFWGSALYLWRFRGGTGAGVDAGAAILGVFCGRGTHAGTSPATKAP